jgi:hypothetical protein
MLKLEMMALMLLILIAAAATRCWQRRPDGDAAAGLFPRAY